jgi:NAD-dependent dihydropyrimidine dehydrogenase PreA subunit
MNKKGYLVPEVIDLENCSECGLCDMYCPEFAIILEKEEKRHERN